MPRMNFSRGCAGIVMLLSLLLTGCGSNPPLPPASGVSDSLIPPLPKTSQQPELPSSYSPTFAAGWSALVQSLPPTPIPPERQGSSASGTTKH